LCRRRRLLAKLSVVASANVFQEYVEERENGCAEEILQSMAVDAAAIRLGAPVETAA
jgi:hypothetical protein